MTEYERIRDDPRTWPAIDKLFCDSLIGDECVFELLQALSTLPKAWESYIMEPPTMRKERREVLANKMRELSRLIEIDPEARYITLLDHESYSTQLFNNRPTLANYLRDISNDFNAKTNYRDLYNDALEEDHTTNLKQRRNTASMKQHEYMIRQVVWIIDVLLRHPVKFPNTTAATLVNIVLDISDFSSEVIATEQIKYRVKYMRQSTNQLEGGNQ